MKVDRRRMHGVQKKNGVGKADGRSTVAPSDKYVVIDGIVRRAKPKYKTTKKERRKRRAIAKARADIQSP